ncbi:MAG: hypothetical protein RLZZ450_305 [Pseudomonadota bacterium]|jgi:hypothetical protein
MNGIELAGLLTNVVTAAAAVSGVAVAFTWPRQKRKEKRAEVAGETLALCLQALDALRWICSPAAIVHKADDAMGLAWAQGEYGRRWEESNGAIEGISKALIFATTYMPEAEETVRALDSWKNRLRASQNLWLSESTYGPDDHDVRPHAIGPELPKQLDQSELALKAILVPIAQYKK